ncbi:MAG: glutamate synthase-related protein, partial [Proteobacteria bacterium]|nr:glutamate synthase-related protein [Pseudomonadota bacterium]
MRAGRAMRGGRPGAQGLYDPVHEHDACGVGFVANIRGEKSHDLIHKGIRVLVNLEHRGACGCDPDTGDGAGITIQLPDRLLRKQAAALGFELPAPGAYASGMVFLSPEADEQEWQIRTLEQGVVEEGQRVLGWRDVPTRPEAIGWLAQESMPVFRQIFVAAADGLDPDALERKLYVIRRVFENRATRRDGEGFVYLPSFSGRTFVFTGMLTASQIEPFYPDLVDPDIESALALVHSRYSTNTFGAWDLAQPFRYLAHNGEINTLKGNRNAMRAREGTFRSELFGDDLEKVYPVMRPASASDSAQFDNALEFLCLNGRELAEAVLMMIPEAWENHTEMSEELRAWYEYHSFLLEPWDGPASIAFTDGRQIGAVLDRNGLRPSRYVVTRDGFVVMASEVGVLDIPPENVLVKGRLHPGKIFLVDLEQGRIVEDEEIKSSYTRRHPYREWVEKNRVVLDDLPPADVPAENMNAELRFQLQQVFGYTSEDLRLLIAPMVADGKWAIGSMGEDAALACLSDRPRMLYHYFKQLFAQVTNPAMDSINEGTVMSLYSTLGAEKNLLTQTPEHARMLRCNRPILRNEELERIRQISLPGFEARTLSALFKVADAGDGLLSALDTLCREAEQAVRDGVNLVILSDRGVTPDLAPIPMLLATGAVHHHLVRAELRTQCGIVCETGEPRDVAQFALLVGYGAGAINPYLAFETVQELVEERTFVPEGIDGERGVVTYLKACDKGLLKTMAKMGISTLQSYRGAQIFEAVGLDRDLVDRCFAGTASRVSGVGYDVIAGESATRHARAFPGEEFSYPELDPGGLYQWRERGERHTFNPDSVAKLQSAVREESYETYKEFARAADGESKRLCTLRGLFKFKNAAEPLPLEEVESTNEIVKRFCTGAM